MDFDNIARTINWKTTGFAGAFIVCRIVGGLVPAIAGVCDVLDSVFVAGGFLSAADSGRVQNVVRAVDNLVEGVKAKEPVVEPVA